MKEEPTDLPKMASNKVDSIKLRLHPDCEFDYHVIKGMEEYEILLGKRTFQEVKDFAENLASKVKMKSGISSIDVTYESGKNENEALINYRLGQTSFLFNFPYEYRRNLGVVQAVFSRRKLPEEEKWYHSLISGSLLGRYQYQYQSVATGHDFIVEKQWDKFWKLLDSSMKIKYSTKLLDANIQEYCWTKGFKVMCDLNKDSVLFKHVPEYREPNYLYAKILHKSRTNFIDLDKCSAFLLKSALSSDSLWQFKIGHKKFLKTETTDSLIKTSAKLGYNGVDSPFTKLSGYLRTNYDIFNKGFATFNNTIQVEQIFSKDPIRINDCLLLKGVKGVYDFPGAKVYKDQLPELGKEHLGDRVGNKFIAQYETKLYFSKLQPFIDNGLVNMRPHIYGTVGYAIPMDGSYNGNKVTDNVRGSTGFGISTTLSPISIELYYSLAGFKPKCDLGREFGIFIGIN